jgi:trehalose synthase
LADMGKNSSLLKDGTVYSKRKDFCPFSTPTPETYASIVGDENMQRLYRAVHQLKGLKILELNATAQGGGVAEMLYSSIPFLNSLGIEAEWKIIRGNQEFFQCTKELHNILQGKSETLTQDMEQCYVDNIESNVNANIIDYKPDVVLVHDPQPLGLVRHLKKPGGIWLWRCHIDIEEEDIRAKPGLWHFVTNRVQHYDAVIFSAVNYVISRWAVPKFLIAPFIDPLSEKNRELSHKEIEKVLDKYNIDPKVQIITQIGRFDPWKGINRTIAVFREVRKRKKCQLVLAGGLASDDPEGERILNEVYEKTKGIEDIHVLNLSMDNRLENWRDVNALQRVASIIMQPSTKEGFGLVITEALWKGKPVIGADVGAIPLQIREGDTGYFYQTPYLTAQKVLYLLENHKFAEEMGEKGRSYVKNHFLLPDRVADYLMAIDMTKSKAVNKETRRDCIISFHPWIKLSKQRKLTQQVVS